MDGAAEMIKRLSLEPHPEGGWYREVHRSTELIQTRRGPASGRPRAAPGAWSLMACDVGPGFDFEDFRVITALEGYQSHFAGPLTQYADLL